MLARVAFIVTVVLVTSVQAAARIDLVLGTTADFPATSVRDWYQMLSEMKVDNLQIRAAAPTDKIEILSQGTDASPVYKVTGILMPGNELILPGGAKFSARDRAGLRAWLDKLRTEGPARAQGAPRPLFGIGEDQFTRVNADLARPVDFATKGQPAKATLEKLASKLAYPLLVEPATAAAFASAPAIDDELQGLAIGTALASILRPAGFVFTPRLNAQRRPEYLVALARSATESWPIGWPLTKPERDVLPGMFETINVEIDQIPAAQVVQAIAERLEIPVLYDRVALARHGIDPAKVNVSIPTGKSMYSIVLRKILFTAGLKYQVRIDEAGKPLMWITTLKLI